jgi:hypothetical protein
MKETDHAELLRILEKFVESGWDLIAVPSKDRLDGMENTSQLITAVRQAEIECGSCG